VDEQGDLADFFGPVADCLRRTGQCGAFSRRAREAAPLPQELRPPIVKRFRPNPPTVRAFAQLSRRAIQSTRLSGRAKDRREGLR
jgi:hypothetical protein